MSDRDGAGRLVLNAVVLATLALTIGAVTDYVAVWMGFDPPVGCGLLPHVQALTMATAMVLAIVGIAIMLLVRNVGAGVTLLLGALLLLVSPEIVALYLTEILGTGCGMADASTAG